MGVGRLLANFTKGAQWFFKRSFLRILLSPSLSFCGLLDLFGSSMEPCSWQFFIILEIVDFDLFTKLEISLNNKPINLITTIVNFTQILVEELLTMSQKQK
jgi:hypothetical protein